MIEKQSVRGKDVWVQVDAHHMERPNPNIIPTEYFTATYYLDEPAGADTRGAAINGEDGQVKLFESPVAALNFARNKLEREL